MAAVSSGAPPPYNGAGSSPEGWTCDVCGIQNPDGVETCCQYGAPRPHRHSPKSSGSGACPSSGSSHFKTVYFSVAAILSYIPFKSLKVNYL
ncbi:hypothetical protein GDO81_010882 [Engystomops pustulosus]|uniref:RanBP2-type domain-containing protein n=1 Tax=Engystomops pustulosus TaxID=76066 RepID=A0AAV7C4S2_ENGPU|nr:hypothetical protein GDO81_010882 [Engystomops pustulosus]